MMDVFRAVRLRELIKQHGANSDDWVTISLKLAHEMAEGRAEHPSNEAFGAWLAAEGLDYFTKDDRAALIAMGEHLDLTRQILPETTRRSYQWIWREEIEPRLRHVTKTPILSSEPPEPPSPAPESADGPAPTAAIETPMPPADAATPSQPSVVEVRRPKQRLRSDSPLQGMPDVELVVAHVLSTQSRAALGRYATGRKGRPVWNLLLASINGGAFGPPSKAIVEIPSLRLILPWAPQEYAKRNPVNDARSLAHIERNILPIAIEHGEQLRARPDELVRLVSEKVDAEHRAANAKFAEARRLEREQALLAVLPPDTTPVRIYGVLLWPPDDQIVRSRYTFRELLEAWWWFHTVHSALAGSYTTREIFMTINNMIRWLPFRQTGWAKAVRQICICFDQNPTGECRVPPAPPNFGLED